MHEWISDYRKVEFLEDFGSNVDEIATAQDEYQKLAQKLQTDRQAKAAAQLAQQQASATNASTDTRYRFSMPNKFMIETCLNTI